MKSIIDFLTFTLFESLSASDIKGETEILYKDAHLVCMIPKTQRASMIYGRGANWCQRRPDGFERWSENSLLVRFLFKSGRKIRFTIDHEGHYHWATEKGHHVMLGQGDPFSYEPWRSSSMEADLIALIATIPEACKSKVRALISCGEIPAYVTDQPEYRTARSEKVKGICDRLNGKYKNKEDEPDFSIFVSPDPKSDRTINIVYSWVDPEEHTLETFKEAFAIEEEAALESRFAEIMAARSASGSNIVPHTSRTQPA
jgi:hypothetical protein